MKFGQAMSVFEAALPEELAGPVPRHADQAAGRRAADAGGDRARRCWPSELGRALAAAVPSLRRRPGGGRLDRPGAPRRSGTTAATVAVKVQYPGAGEALHGRPQPDRPDGPAVRRAGPGHGHQAAARRAAGARGRGARLPLEARRPARVRRGVRRRPRLRRPRRRRTAPSTVLVTEWLEGTPLATVIADGHAGRARPRRAAATCGSCSPARPGPGCCTPTRTRATSGCSPTAGSACSTSAPSPGCPTACPPRSGGCCGIALDGDADGGRSTGLRDEGFIKPGVDARRRGAARLPGAVRRAGRGAERSSFDRAWMRGAVQRASTTRAPAVLRPG